MCFANLSPAYAIVCGLQEYKGQQLKQLVHALCPAIYGHELVKAGVLLSLFGGVRKGSEDQASAPVRGDIHCLLVGDPGIGKSQLLKVLSSFAQSTERREFRLFCDVFHPERTLRQKILQGESHGHVSLQLRAVLYFYNTLLARHSCSFDCSCSSEWRSQLQKAVMTCDCDNEVVLTEVHQQC